jgi:anti-sigma B factor antagonist
MVHIAPNRRTGSPPPTAPTTLLAEVDADAAATVVRLRGELDASTNPQLERALRDVPDGEVVLDLSELSFLDSAGLTALVRFRNRRSGAYRSVVLRNPAPQIRRLLSISGLDRLFPVEG